MPPGYDTAAPLSDLACYLCAFQMISKCQQDMTLVSSYVLLMSRILGQSDTKTQISVNLVDEYRSSRGLQEHHGSLGIK